MRIGSMVLLAICGAGAFLLPLVIRPNVQSLLRFGIDSQTSTNRLADNHASTHELNGGVSHLRPVHTRSSNPRINSSPSDSFQVGQNGPVQLSSWNQTANDLVVASPVAVETAAFAPEQATNRLDLRAWLLKLGFATCVVLSICVASLQFGSKLVSKGRQSTSELKVCDSVTLSHEVAVKLIRVGNERIVVGHDKQGMRSMVLLPARFDEVLAKQQRAESPKGAVHLAGDLRMALANPKDKGWDLNQPIS